MGQIGEKFRRRFSEASLTAGALLAAAPVLAVSKKDKTNKGDENGNGNNDKKDAEQKANNDGNQTAASTNDSNDRQGGDKTRIDNSENQNAKSANDTRNDRRNTDAPADGENQADDNLKSGDGARRHDFADLSQKADPTPTAVPATSTPTGSVPVVSPVDANGIATIQNPDGGVVVGFDDSTGRLVAISGDVEASVGPGGPMVIIPNRQTVVPVGNDPTNGGTTNGGTTGGGTTSGGDTSGGDNNTDFAS